MNFVVWGDTSSCGVSAIDHLLTGMPMAQALFLFHAYHQVHCILAGMEYHLSTDDAWDAKTTIIQQHNMRGCAPSLEFLYTLT